jgi:hypothetical protein
MFISWLFPIFMFFKQGSISAEGIKAFSDNYKQNVYLKNIIRSSWFMQVQQETD